MTAHSEKNEFNSSAVHLAALDTLCPDCPKKTSGELVPFQDEVRNKEREVETMGNVVMTAAVKEEYGCDGAWYCSSCDDPHCGASESLQVASRVSMAGFNKKTKE